PLDSLHADAGYLIGRVLDKSLTADDVVSIIRSRIDEARAALAAPAHPATAGDAEDAARLDWRPPETAPRDMTVILGDFGFPWPMAAVWNAVLEKWCCAEVQIDMFYGTYND